LRASTVFGSLGEEPLAELVDAMDWCDVLGGDYVFREGDVSDSAVFVISGGLRVSRRNRDGQLLLYNQVYPGQSVGEINMILRQPRTQDVIAVRDTTLALLHRDAYEALVTRHPLAVSGVFLKAIYDRLRHDSEVHENKGLAQTFAVLPLHDGVDAHAVAVALTQALAKSGAAANERVGHVWVRPGTQQTMLGDVPLAGPDNMGALQDDHEVLVYEAEAHGSDWTRYALRQADQVILVAAAGASPALSAIERELMQDPGYKIKRHHLVLMHARHNIHPELPTAWLPERDLERVYPVRAGSMPDSEHVARFLSGKAVGVVLGGGGARGFAHLGVLKALAEANIPIDVIGGNSMGALIGAQLACGDSLEQILAQTVHFAGGGERLTLPLVSLVSGKRVARDLRRMFGERLIEGLWRPFFASACNLSRGTVTAQDKGLLWRAVLASNSPAGLFPPVVYDGELLVDAAILENVPVLPMRMRLGPPLERRRGNGNVIAVDVDVRENPRAGAGLTRITPLSRLKRLLRSSAPDSPGIGEILYSVGHIGGASRRGQAIAQANHYLEPPVAEFPLMAYERAAEIAEVGYRYATEKIRLWDLDKPHL
jgi:NTE family protein/lysophospholipid hydrolase